MPYAASPRLVGGGWHAVTKALLCGKLGLLLPLVTLLAAV